MKSLRLRCLSACLAFQQAFGTDQKHCCASFAATRNSGSARSPKLHRHAAVESALGDCRRRANSFWLICARRRSCWLRCCAFIDSSIGQTTSCLLEPSDFNGLHSPSSNCHVESDDELAARPSASLGEVQVAQALAFFVCGRHSRLQRALAILGGPLARCAGDRGRPLVGDVGVPGAAGQAACRPPLPVSAREPRTTTGQQPKPNTAAHHAHGRAAERAAS